MGEKVIYSFIFYHKITLSFFFIISIMVFVIFAMILCEVVFVHISCFLQHSHSGSCLKVMSKKNGQKGFVWRMTIFVFINKIANRYVLMTKYKNKVNDENFSLF